MSQIKCGVEWPGTWVPSGSPFEIIGWVFDPQGEIGSLHAQIDDGPRVPCRYGLVPDQVVGAFVGKPSVQFARIFENRDYSGSDSIESFHSPHKRQYEFTSVLDPLELFGEHSLRIIGRLHDGDEREFLCQTLSFVHPQDPRLEIFSGECPLWNLPGFDPSALVFDEIARPLFVLGNDSRGVHAATSVVCRVTKLPVVDDTRLLYAMRRWVIEAKNVWDQFLAWDLTGWQPLDSAVGNFEIYSLINKILENCIRHLRCEARVPSWISPLPADIDHGMAHWLKHLFPCAKFLLVGSPSGNGSDTDAWERLLKRVERQPFQECALVSRDTAVRAENEPALPLEVMDFLESLIVKGHQTAGCNTEVDRVPDQNSTDWLLDDISATDQRILNRISVFAEEQPIFIIGSGRSGTSALVGALTEAAGIGGWREGHLFPVGQTIMASLLRSWREIASLFPHWPRSNFDVVQSLDTVAREIHFTYKKKWTDLRWLDKTPDSGMLDCLPLLIHMYPQIRIVCMRRHPIPWIASRRRKFSEAIDLSCHEWTTFLRRWKELKSSLPNLCWCEFDQTELSRKTRFVAATLQKLLVLDDEATSGIESYLRLTRPEATASATVTGILHHGIENADETSDRLLRRQYVYGKLRDRCSHKLENIELLPEEADEVKRLCSDIAADYGYRLDSGLSSIPEILADIAAQIETLEFQLHAAEYRCQDAELYLERKTEMFQDEIARLAEEVRNWQHTAAHRDKTIAWLQGEMERWKCIAEEREKNAQYLADQLRNWQHTAAHRDKTIAWLQGEMERWKCIAEEREKNAQSLADQLAKLR
jgi:hypothetical protein